MWQTMLSMCRKLPMMYVPRSGNWVRNRAGVGVPTGPVGEALQH
jgi:hypothetical protein